MKKLLSLLGEVILITIEASGVIGCGGEKVKTEIIKNLKKINDIRGQILNTVLDSKDNIYFTTSFNGGLYRLSAGSDTPTIINETNYEFVF